MRLIKGFASLADQRKSGRFSCAQIGAVSIIVTALLLLGLAVSMPLWLPPLVRTLMLDRYVDTYAPDFVREMVFEVDVSETLPTAVPVAPVTPDALLDGILPTPTSGPTHEATVAATGEVVETATATPALTAAFKLEPFTHTYQGWNNCGPATLTTTLSYWNLGVTQADVAGYVKPNPEDRNVRPDELAAYVRSVGYDAIVRADGDLLLLKRILSAGYPVLIEKGFDPEPDRLGWMGHYLLLTGYSDADAAFSAMDSYLGPDTVEPYDATDQFWRHFNRTYIVVFPAEDRSKVEAIIGPEMDDTNMYNNAIRTAQGELAVNPNDAFGWFNIGSSLTALGDYMNAAQAFDQARSIGVPWRMLWYQFGPYEAYLHMQRYEDVLLLGEVILADNPYSEEAYYYRGLAYRGRGENEYARNQFRLALRNNSNYTAAQQALEALGS